MKRTPLKRGRWRKRPADPALAFLFKQEVCEKGRCVMAGVSAEPCDDLGFGEQAHHVIAKQTLRKRGFSEAVVYDSRNGIPLCVWHHERHTWGKERVPLSLLPDSARAFAAEYGLTDLLERYYGADLSSEREMSASHSEGF